MSQPRKRIKLPLDWVSVTGLWFEKVGMSGVIYYEPAERMMVFEGVHVITCDATEWTVGDVVRCLAYHQTPRWAEPAMVRLSGEHLAPLLACGALTQIERLALLAHVPGWEP